MFHLLSIGYLVSEISFNIIYLYPCIEEMNKTAYLEYQVWYFGLFYLSVLDAAAKDAYKTEPSVRQYFSY